jgi:hypothetical protein
MLRMRRTIINSKSESDKIVIVSSNLILKFVIVPTLKILKMRIFAIKILLLFLCSAPVLSQTGSDRKMIIWDINFTSGGVTGGPGNDMNNFLIDAGHNYSCHTVNRLPVVFSTYLSMTRNLRIGLNLSMFDQYLKPEYFNTLCSFKSIAISPLISYNYRNLIFLEAGPALNSISYYHSTGSSLNDDVKFMNPGFTFKSALEFPRKTKLYIRMEMQYSYAGEIDPRFSIENRYRQYMFTTLQADNLPMSYFYYGIGLGFRLFSKTVQSGIN